MTGINLRVATLKNAKLKNCNLRGATLAGTDLEVCLAGPSQEIILQNLHCDSAGGEPYVQQLSGDKKDETEQITCFTGSVSTDLWSCCLFSSSAPCPSSLRQLSL